MTQQIATDTTFRVIFTCRNRNCKHVFAFDYHQEGIDRYNLPYGTRELKEGEEQSRYDHQGRRSLNADVMGDLRCPKCRVNLPKSNRVNGTLNESHKCNAKCQSSKSGVCSCSCGGKNHGIAYL